MDNPGINTADAYKVDYLGIGTTDINGASKLGTSIANTDKTDYPFTTTGDVD